MILMLKKKNWATTSSYCTCPRLSPVFRVISIRPLHYLHKCIQLGKFIAQAISLASRFSPHTNHQFIVFFFSTVVSDPRLWRNGLGVGSQGL